MNKTFVWPLGRTWPTVAAAIESNREEEVDGGRGVTTDCGQRLQLPAAVATNVLQAFQRFVVVVVVVCCLLQWPIVVGVGWRGSSRKQFSLKQQQQQQ